MGCVVCVVEKMVDSDVGLKYSEVNSFDSWLDAALVIFIVSVNSVHIPTDSTVDISVVTLFISVNGPLESVVKNNSIIVDIGGRSVELVDVDDEIEEVDADLMNSWHVSQHTNQLVSMRQRSLVQMLARSPRYNLKLFQETLKKS